VPLCNRTALPQACSIFVSRAIDTGFNHPRRVPRKAGQLSAILPQVTYLSCSSSPGASLSTHSPYQLIPLSGNHHRKSESFASSHGSLPYCKKFTLPKFYSFQLHGPTSPCPAKAQQKYLVQHTHGLMYLDLFPCLQQHLDQLISSEIATLF